MHIYECYDQVSYIPPHGRNVLEHILSKRYIFYSEANTREIDGFTNITSISMTREYIFHPFKVKCIDTTYQLSLYILLLKNLTLKSFEKYCLMHCSNHMTALCDITDCVFGDTSFIFLRPLLALSLDPCRDPARYGASRET